MAGQEKTVHKKSRGRPAGTRYGETIPVRLEIGTTKAVDQWADKQELSRSEAIRRLVELGLASTRAPAPTNKKAAAKASDLAGQMIDRLGDGNAAPDERAKRKRRLLKGPPEFRKMRADLAKTKR